jgi:transcriptional regulator with XRE-family HTH domain
MRGGVPASRAETARNVRAVRAYAWLDQLAQRVGLNRSALMRLESGAMSLDHDLAARLESVTGAPAWFLLEGFEGRPS